MQNCLGTHWHHLSIDDAVSLLDSDAAAGLDHFEVQHRQQRFGSNSLTPRKAKSPILLFLLQFHQPLVYILIGAGILTAVLGEWIDSGVILGVVLVNAIIGFVQEAKAVRAIEALSRSMTADATVIRAGRRHRISAAELVPGDLVLLQSGDKVPADLRLIRSRELQVDESALTGESLPVQKSSDDLPRDTVLADRQNMAYSSTLVTYGTAAGLVIATGDQTEIGRINEMIAEATDLETPLTKKISQFSRVLLFVILGLAAATFVVGLLRGESWVEMFMAAVALAVGAIPEGLPAAVTITLAVGVKKMARRNAIIRKLPAVETLGSTTIICSDKTGTLTQNQMTVQEIVAGGERFTLTGIGYDPQGEVRRDGASVDPSDNAALVETLLAGLHCQDSRLVEVEGIWRVEGDPTEGALITAAGKAHLHPESVTRELPRVDAIPFESEYQYMATLHRDPDGKCIAYLKGSVEQIAARCETALSSRGEKSSFEPEHMHLQASEMASRGLRVLAFARKEFSTEANTIEHPDVQSGLMFLGLQAMIDPPRNEAIAAIKACQTAGVRVKMITGDHARTAAAIATQIGLEGVSDGDGRLLALTGQELAQIDDTMLIQEAERVAVFARVAPEQKLRLVEALQATGHVVAMTGDGVNDAPALRQANIGVAMGVAGTEVAKEAADMVLADDNFSSIEAAVEEGRGVYDNLVKFITWTLPTNIGEGLVILVAIIAGVQLPILPVQILWINMTTAVLLGLVLAFEPKEPGIMRRPPRHPSTPVLTAPLAFRILLVGLLLLAGSFGLFEWMLAKGKSLEIARTVAVNVFVMGEIFYLFNCRSLKYSMFRLGLLTNRWVPVGVGLMLALQLAYTYLPAMNYTFESAPISLVDWGMIVAVGLVIYLVVGIEKWIQNRRAR